MQQHQRVRINNIRWLIIMAVVYRIDHSIDYVTRNYAYVSIDLVIVYRIHVIQQHGYYRVLHVIIFRRRKLFHYRMHFLKYLPIYLTIWYVILSFIIFLSFRQNTFFAFYHRLTYHELVVYVVDGNILYANDEAIYRKLSIREWNLNSPVDWTKVSFDSATMINRAMWLSSVRRFISIECCSQGLIQYCVDLFSFVFSKHIRIIDGIEIYFSVLTADCVEYLQLNKLHFDHITQITLLMEVSRNWVCFICYNDYLQPDSLNVEDLFAMLVAVLTNRYMHDTTLNICFRHDGYRPKIAALRRQLVDSHARSLRKICRIRKIQEIRHKHYCNWNLTMTSFA